MDRPAFIFSQPFVDARVEELKLLTAVAQAGKLEVSGTAIADHAWLDLIVALLWQDSLTKFTTDWAERTLSLTPRHYADGTHPGGSRLEGAIGTARIQAIQQLFERKAVELHITHFGRVRLSELKQELRSGREREPFGILWDVRHWEQDVQIALLEAGEERPLSLAYLDMNGLKRINDTHGHEAGDLALKTYFQCVASVLGDQGQAYRLSGGADEVLVLMPNRSEQIAAQLIRLACQKLMSERLWPTDPEALLSIAAGITSVTDPTFSPTKLRAAADEQQKRAKLRSRANTPRPSVIGIDGRDDLILIEHDKFILPIRIVGSYFMRAANDKGITLTVTNNGRDPLLPYKVGIFHPRTGSWFIFPSERTGALLPDQRREHSCTVIHDGRLNPIIPLVTQGEGGPIGPDDDHGFELRLVLEDSDNKILYSNRRIGRGFMALLRLAAENKAEIHGTWQIWRELDTQLPDE